MAGVRGSALWAVGGVVVLLCSAAHAAERDAVAPRSRRTLIPEVSRAERHDISPPLWLLPPAPKTAPREDNAPLPLPRPRPGPLREDPVLQASVPPLLVPSAMLSLDGVGQGFSGPAGTFSVNSAPPDTNGDVGPNHYVETVNTDFAIFDKAGTVLFGPVPINTLWSGFGGGCQTNNDGDPIVLYDPIADRWLISQFSVSTTPFLQCVAVSQTSDPTGAYSRYSFSYSGFNDYPKFGVWPDAYYVSFNMFNAAGTAFLGGKVCAYDRAKMLTGAAATQQCFDVGTSFGGLLPADLDGARLPPAGAPNPIVALGSFANQLAFWKFHVDWTTPASSTLTGPTTLATAAFSEACGGGKCITQSGTLQKLDSLADRLMYRLAYRNFGDHEALVFNHSVTAGAGAGVRWYEIRLAGGVPSIFQQGTYAPDSNFRWMGSIAMDQSGDMGVGFSVSGAALHPEIRYAGRLVGDPAGQLSQGESTFIAGAGSQTGSSLSRWGDYSMMAVDPSDDCTFWFTSEYIPANGAFNWRTRISTFKFPDCGPPPASDFSIGASPDNATVVQGGSTTSSISTLVTSGSAESVALSVTGGPAGVTASFSPTSVTAGGSSTLTISVGAATVPGPYTLTITGTSPSATHSTSFALTVAATAPTISIDDVSLTEGNSGTKPAAFTVSLSQASASTVTVQYATAPGTATASADYTSLALTTLSFAPGETSKPLSVSVKGDLLDENDETFFVNLSNPVNATIAKAQGVGTILDDDASPVLSINSPSTTEGSANHSVTFKVALSPASGKTVTVNYATANDTALAPGDYAAKSGTLTFNPGSTSKNVMVTVRGDLAHESTEDFFVNLTSPANATIGTGQGVGTILDDDAVAPPVTASINDVSVTEGNSGTTSAVFTVTLSAPATVSSTVDYATAPGTATATTDYTTKSGTLTFAVGQTSKTISVVVKGETRFEANETFFVNLSSPTGVTITDGQGVGTILNDDPAPTLSIADPAAVTEGDSGMKNLTFTVSLSNASDQTVTVQYATADDTAVAPGDYTAKAPTTLTFNPGTVAKTFTVAIKGDLVHEASEDFFVNLSNPTNVSIADGQAVATILDNDP